MSGATRGTLSATAAGGVPVSSPIRWGTRNATSRGGSPIAPNADGIRSTAPASSRTRLKILERCVEQEQQPEIPLAGQQVDGQGEYQGQFGKIQHWLRVVYSRSADVVGRRYGIGSWTGGASPSRDARGSA
jgi:hypothetical protein